MTTASRAKRRPPAATQEEAIAEALAPAPRHVGDFARLVDGKVVAQRWRDKEGRVLFVAQIGAKSWSACVAGPDGEPKAAFTLAQYWPSLDFEHAQEELDRYASRHGWTPETPLPEDDDAEQARAAAEQEKPARRANGRKSSANGNGRSGPTVGEAAEAQGVLSDTQVRELSIDLIGPSPFNPRRDFPKAELVQLAESIKTSGVIQPVIVRKAPKSADRPFELVAGERRWRAAALAGRKTLPAIVRAMDDARARRDCLAENLNRRDLSAVEKARGLKGVQDAEPGLTQKELGERFGMEQGTVSNLLRLLELPEAWQARIISGEISERHARAVLPYREHPKLFEALAKSLKRGRGDDPLSAEDFERQIGWKVREATEPMTGERWESRLGRSVKVFTPTDEQRQALGIVKVTNYNGKAEERATNKALWKKLQGDHLATQLAKAKKAAKAKASGNGKPASKKLTPAQARAKAKEEAWQYEHWLRQQVTEAKARFLADYFSAKLEKIPGVDLPDSAQVLRGLVLTMVTEVDAYGIGRDLFGRPGKLSVREMAARAVGQLDEAGVEAIGCKVLTSVMVNAENEPCLEPELVWSLFDQVGLDLGLLFRYRQLNEASESYWRGPEKLGADKAKARLLDLARETKLEGITEDQGLDVMVKAALANCPGPDAKEAGPVMPKEIKKCKLK